MIRFIGWMILSAAADTGVSPGAHSWLGPIIASFLLFAYLDWVDQGRPNFRLFPRRVGR